MTTCICTHPRSHAFRYLGLQARVDIHPAFTTRILQGRVWAACNTNRLHRLNLTEAAFYLRECVYPKLELGLLCAEIPKGTLDMWDGLLRRHMLGTYRGVNVRSVSMTQPCSSRRTCFRCTTPPR